MSEARETLLVCRSQFNDVEVFVEDRSGRFVPLKMSEADKQAEQEFVEKQSLNVADDIPGITELPEHLRAPEPVIAPAPTSS